jgi:hypothetical protein
MTPNEVYNSLTFFCWKYLYSVGIFTHEIFFLYVLLKEERFSLKEETVSQIRFSGVIDSAEILHLIVIAIFAVSLSPLKLWRKKICDHPYKICCFTIMIISAVSLIPLKLFQRCHWHGWNEFRGVNYTVKMTMTTMTKASVVSLTLQKRFQRCHWHHWNSNIFDYLGDTKHMRNGYNMLIRDLGGFDLCDKLTFKKSTQTMYYPYWHYSRKKFSAYRYV